MALLLSAPILSQNSIPEEDLEAKEESGLRRIVKTWFKPVHREVIRDWAKRLEWRLPGCYED